MTNRISLQSDFNSNNLNQLNIKDTLIILLVYKVRLQHHVAFKCSRSLLFKFKENIQSIFNQIFNHWDSFLIQCRSPHSILRVLFTFY